MINWRLKVFAIAEGRGFLLLSRLSFFCRKIQRNGAYVQRSCVYTKILIACEGDASKIRTRDPPSKIIFAALFLYQTLKSCFYFYQTNF